MTSVEPVDLDDDALLEELVRFEASAGTPRYSTPAEWRAGGDRVDHWIGLVARDEHGAIVGSSEALVHPTFGPSSIQVNATVADSDHRVLDALMQAVIEWEHAQATTSLTGHVADPDAMVERMWRAAGFERIGERTRLRRTLSPDEALPEPALPDGVRIVALADVPELEAAADATWRDVHRDIPTELPFAPGDDLTIRRDLRLAEDEPLPPTLVVAVAGDDEVVGIAFLDMDPATRAWAGHRMTGVVAPWRGRGIARALKLDQLRWAQAHGITELQASNDDSNPAMRHLNDELGYEPMKRLVLMRRTLA